jgi:hypothetical protein
MGEGIAALITHELQTATGAGDDDRAAIVKRGESVSEERARRLDARQQNLDARAEQLAEKGCPVDKRSIELDEPIKMIGIYKVPVRLHPEVRAEVRVWVVKE